MMGPAPWMVVQGPEVESAGGKGTNSTDREPYQVPPAWQSVLSAWNDPSWGVGLEDSVLSNGEFERPGMHPSTVAAAAEGSEANMGMSEPGESAGHAAAASVAPGEESATEMTDRARSGPSSIEREAEPKQRSIRAWLK